ncbi:hypothetical protein MTO96_003175 [Rhipicephalus appendiculatus]
MSELEKIKKGLLKSANGDGPALFEDPDFPASQNSVFYHQTPPFKFTWLRPKEICSSPQFVSDGPSQFDITPGKLGDRWFVSCLGVLATCRGLFYRVVPADQGFGEADDYVGLFRFRLWWCGDWKEVIIDDRLPTVNGKLVFVQSGHGSLFWAALLEKAYANISVLVTILVLAAQSIYVYPSCEDPSCWDFTTSLYRSLNYTASPCDNFYHFVCDGWKSSHGTNEFVFSELQAMVAHAAVNSLLRVGHAPSLRQTAVQKAAVMFKTCVQVFMNRVDNTESLKSFLRSLDLLTPRPETVDVLDVVVGLALDWNVPVFLQMSVEHDTTLDGMQTLYFSRSRHLMDWFLRRSRMDGWALYNYVVTCSQVVDYQFNAEVLIFFENYIMSSLGALTDTAHVTHTIKITDMENHTPGILSSEWLDVINRHLPEAALLKGSDTIRVTDIAYLRVVSETILDDRRRRNGHLLLYVAWFVIQFLGPFASLSLVTPSFANVKDARNYIFFRCFEELNQLMPYAFGAPFAVESVPVKARDDVLTMVLVVKNALKDSFLKSKWMDNATRNIAILKLHTMRTIVAYPDMVINALDEYYAYTPDSSAVFLDSRMRAWYVTMRIRKDRLWKPRTFDYDFRLTDVNAFYQPLTNTMIIPAGIINSPFYSAKYPLSVNFGGLGHVIAHEIVHGFDDDSIREPKDGLSRDWWTMDARTQYEQRVRCLKRMYFPLGLNSYDRSAVMSEDIADSVGLAQAQKAYRSLRHKNNAVVSRDAPLMSRFTEDQAFYVMSCFKWCSNRRDAGRGYSSDELRCNVPLQNIPDFARAFSCRRNDPMNPAHKLYGSYEALKYGCSVDGLADLTGGVTETLNIREDPSGCARTLAGSLLARTTLVTAVVQQQHTQSRTSPEKMANGIWLGTNYRILSFQKVTTAGGEQVQLVKLRNPFGVGADYIGSWSLDSLEWDKVPPEEQERLNYKSPAEGEFWMSYQDFMKTFTSLEVVHLDSETSRDELSLRDKTPWQMKVWKGHWQKGVTAGGCRNNTDTFHINPQFQLILSESEEVVISLSQDAVIEPKVMGFTIYQTPKPPNEALDKAFFKKNKSLLSSQYSNCKQVSVRCVMEQGGYVLLPTTFELGQEASFTLRVFSGKPTKLKLIDNQPSTVKPAIMKAPPSFDSKISSYEAVFLQVADEHSSVNCFELQELLEACLPNDYVKSCATLEVCRQVVMALDTTGLGRLRYQEYKNFMCSLKYWQSTFKKHTRGTAGILRAEKLRDAIVDVGFQLNTDILSMLMLRYMRKDGTLRFGDFVSCILHLSVAFATFEKKDPLQNGFIKMTLAEWLKTSLQC